MECHFSLVETHNQHVSRARASELRGMAAKAKDAMVRSQLLDLAGNWDDIANRTERQAGTIARRSVNRR